MWRKVFIFLIAIMMPVLTADRGAIGDMNTMPGSHMMGGEMGEMGEMDDESCMKGPGMMMHKMGKRRMQKGMHMPMMYSWEYLKERLNLTDEQADRLGKIYSHYRKDMLRRKAEVEIAEMDLAELLTTKESSEKAVEEKANSLESLRSELNISRVKALLETREFLSDEQYEDLANFILRWMRPSKMRGMMGPWYGCMDGMHECR